LCEVYISLVSAAESENLCRLRACSVSLPRLVYSNCLLLKLVHQALYEALNIKFTNRSYNLKFINRNYNRKFISRNYNLKVNNKSYNLKVKNKNYNLKVKNKNYYQKFTNKSYDLKSINKNYNNLKYNLNDFSVPQNPFHWSLWLLCVMVTYILCSVCCTCV
jgi:hypothetical protein